MLRRNNVNTQQDEPDLEFLVNSNTDSPDNSLDNSDTNSDEDVELKKTKKKLTILGVIAGCVIALLVSFKLSTSLNSNDEVAKEQYKQIQLQEPHSSMRYYLIDEQSEDSLEAAGLLIGHVMETGCSTAYSALLEVFPDSSLEQLYEHLKGKACTEYSRAKVVRIKESEYFYEYLVKLDRNSKDYIIKINHDNYRVTEFNISEYTKEK